jgi:hypothetical protein
MSGTSRAAWALLVVGCGSGGVVYTWSTGDGVACVRERAGGYAVEVDFQQLIECVDADAVSCEVELDGDRLVVTAGGRMETSSCPPGGTIAPVAAECGPVDLADGAYTLAYGDREVAIELPLADGAEICTGPR